MIGLLANAAQTTENACRERNSCVRGPEGAEAQAEAARRLRDGVCRGDACVALWASAVWDL